MKKMLLIITLALVGCLDVEDKTREVDQFECYRKVSHLGVEAKWFGLFDLCALYINGDTVYYKLKQ